MVGESVGAVASSVDVGGFGGIDTLETPEVIVNLAGHYRRLNAARGDIADHGEMLLEIRKGLGLSQRKLGALLGVTNTYISKIENGHLPISAELAQRIDERIGHG